MSAKVLLELTDEESLVLAQFLDVGIRAEACLDDDQMTDRDSKRTIDIGQRVEKKLIQARKKLARGSKR